MKDYAIQKILDTVEGLVKQSRATFSTGAKVTMPVRKTERKGNNIKVYFYIPASDIGDRNLSKAEFLDEKGNVIDEQINKAKIVRRKGFMTIFEYTYNGVI